MTAGELAAEHRAMCAAIAWEPCGWPAVGRELRRLLGAAKTYADVDRRRQRVFRIPPAAAARPRLVA